MQKYQVALLGLNSVFGRMSSLLLKQSKVVKQLSLYDDNNVDSAKDISIINTNCQVQAFLGKEKLNEAIKGADLIIIGDDHLSTPHTSFDRMAPKICEYAEAVATSSPDAIVVIAASPVNVLVPLFSEVLMERGCYDCNKVIGATAVDNARANSMLASKLNVSPHKVTLPVIGGNSKETRVPLISQANPSVSIPQDVHEFLIKSVKETDNIVFSMKSPEALNKAFTTVRFLNTIFNGLQGQPGNVSIAFCKTTIVPEVDYFSLPVQFGRFGIQKRYKIPRLLSSEEKLIHESIQVIRHDIERAKHFLKSKESQVGMSSSISTNEYNMLDRINSQNKDNLKSDLYGKNALPLDGTEQKADNGIRRNFESKRLLNLAPSNYNSMVPVVISNTYCDSTDQKSDNNKAHYKSSNNEISLFTISKKPLSFPVLNEATKKRLEEEMTENEHTRIRMSSLIWKSANERFRDKKNKIHCLIDKHQKESFSDNISGVSTIDSDITPYNRKIAMGSPRETNPSEIRKVMESNKVLEKIDTVYSEKRADSIISFRSSFNDTRNVSPFVQNNGTKLENDTIYLGLDTSKDSERTRAIEEKHFLRKRHPSENTLDCCCNVCPEEEREALMSDRKLDIHTFPSKNNNGHDKFGNYTYENNNMILPTNELNISENAFQLVLNNSAKGIKTQNSSPNLDNQSGNLPGHECNSNDPVDHILCNIFNDIEDSEMFEMSNFNKDTSFYSESDGNFSTIEITPKETHLMSIADVKSSNSRPDALSERSNSVIPQTSQSALDIDIAKEEPTFKKQYKDTVPYSPQKKVSCYALNLLTVSQNECDSVPETTISSFRNANHANSETANDTYCEKNPNESPNRSMEESSVSEKCPQRLIEKVLPNASDRRVGTVVTYLHFGNKYLITSNINDESFGLKQKEENVIFPHLQGRCLQHLQLNETIDKPKTNEPSLPPKSNNRIDKNIFSIPSWKKANQLHMNKTCNSSSYFSYIKKLPPRQLSFSSKKNAVWSKLNPVDKNLLKKDYSKEQIIHQSPEGSQVMNSVLSYKKTKLPHNDKVKQLNRVARYSTSSSQVRQKSSSRRFIDTLRRYMNDKSRKVPANNTISFQPAKKSHLKLLEENSMEKSSNEPKDKQFTKRTIMSKLISHFFLDSYKQKMKPHDNESICDKQFNDTFFGRPLMFENPHQKHSVGPSMECFTRRPNGKNVSLRSNEKDTRETPNQFSKEGCTGSGINLLMKEIMQTKPKYHLYNDAYESSSSFLLRQKFHNARNMYTLSKRNETKRGVYTFPNRNALCEQFQQSSTLCDIYKDYTTVGQQEYSKNLKFPDIQSLLSSNSEVNKYMKSNF